ncbi:MAG TPA: hypothetical protein VLX91_05795 [Candidatus Acidoferrales bacterium]|nr:hypothetical protein [Candidatus Acidoferrales bacterium]
MPELFTILTVTFVVVVVVIISIAVVIHVRKLGTDTQAGTSNEHAASTNPIDITEPVDSDRLPQQTVDEKEQEPLRSTNPTPSSLINTEEEEGTKQAAIETEINFRKSADPTIADSNKPKSDEPANGLNGIGSSEPLTQLEGGEAESKSDHQPKQVRNISPENRGGARRGKRTNDAKESDSGKKQRVRRPEIVCWLQSRKWFVGIEMPTDIGGIFQGTATLGGTPLTKVSDSHWTVPCLLGNIRISGLRGVDIVDLPLGTEQVPYLLFKLSGETLNVGRRVRYTTSGMYLVVAPLEWSRDEKQSGLPRVPPYPCHLSGFQAHYFHLDSENDGRIAFIASDGEIIQIPSSNSHFDFEGCRIIDDANDEMGPLFGQNPPFLVASDKSIWKNVETIVIGEEGKSSSGWRTAFKLNAEDARVDLCSSLQVKDGGWFFVRIYDSNDELIDSLDFRFIRNLRSIKTDEHSVLPIETGHQPTKITLECEETSSFKVVPFAHNLKSGRSDETKIEIEIPSQPEYDRTEWTLVSSTKSRVNVSLLVERVWWAICEKGTSLKLSQWKDKYLSLTSEHLKASSDLVLRIRFPKPKWARQVQVGFHKGHARTYPVEVTKNTVDIPLNHFEGVSQLEDPSKDHPLFLSLEGFSEQVMALLTCRREKKKTHQQKRKTKIRLNVPRLLKYLNRLGRYTKDDKLSSLINECKQKWSSPEVRERRDEYLSETACVIALSWKLLKAKELKVIGKRKGWIRNLVKLADAEPYSFSSTMEKYKMLSGNDKVASSN